ncbi:hypothetical protein K469DRAFT_752360 [Zopfia rhizophila CBS 207.26]|uniref:Uncharacterized protein n=1 Tax=Zopfia rhizophila CBS 207.26 TaxID=1314779 RepID=A0A6A6DVT8_9PEZI|nr:hypothetical protein K469DRAFT_752360 [Zopfia rhizophila CBS 207.26]
MAATLRNFEPYIRYCRFLVMPRGAEEFTETDNGVVIKYGEIRCRVMGHGRVLCSQKVGTRGALVTHVMEQHGIEVAPSDNEGPSNIYLRGVKEHDRQVTAETRAAQERERLRNSVPAPINRRMEPLYDSNSNVSTAQGRQHDPDHVIHSPVQRSNLIYLLLSTSHKLLVTYLTLRSTSIS